VQGLPETMPKTIKELNHVAGDYSMFGGELGGSC
jgi:hypothetical protein